MILRGCAIFMLLVLALGTVPAKAEEQEQLEAMDIAQLMEVKVTTASRRPDRLSRVAGAVTVIDEEDIARSGATTIPEALRLVPGVHVTRKDTDKWAIGIRGFSNMFGNKQLILVNGRPITSPTFTGVFWGNQSVPMSNIKRIEVVRGVWTSLWGSDSFNGVINIITKTAKEMNGGTSVTRVGTDGMEQSLSYGMPVGDSTDVALFTKGSYYDGMDMHSPHGSVRSTREWKQGSGGIRVDWDNAFTDTLSFESMVASTQSERGSGIIKPKHPSGGSNDNSAGFMQFTWDRTTGLDAGIRFRTSYSAESVTMGDLDGLVNVADMEVLYAMEQAGSHRFTWGIGGRIAWDKFDNSEHIHMTEDKKSRFDSNAFVQDRITLHADDLFLIFGFKVDYRATGFLGLQPTARLLYTKDDHEFWIAASHAQRSPDRWTEDGRYKLDYKGHTYTLDNSGGLKNERLYSLEAGYRQIFSPQLTFDLSTYVNHYDNMAHISYDKSTYTASTNNDMWGTAYGLETSLDWKPRNTITIRPSLSVLVQNMREGDEQWTRYNPSDAPIYEAKLFSMIDLAPSVGFNTLLRYRDCPSEDNFDSAFTIDASLSWQATESLKLELLGQNILDDDDKSSPLEDESRFSVRATWNF